MKRYWQKTIIYCRKLFRQEGSPESIARGAALGLLAAFLIPIGLHTVSILLFGFIFRCNKITAMGITFLISNEITIPLIYPLQCLLGSYVILDALSLHHIKTMLVTLFAEFSWAELVSAARDIGVPYLVGGSIVSCIIVPPGYYLVLGGVRKMRARREARRRRQAIIAAAPQEEVVSVELKR